MLMLNRRSPTLSNQVLNLVVNFVLSELWQKAESLESISCLVITNFVAVRHNLFLFMYLLTFKQSTNDYLTSNLSTVSNSNLISFQVSIAIASSGLCLAASVRMSLPSRSSSRPSLRALTQASNATRLAAAPAALPHG